MISLYKSFFSSFLVICYCISGIKYVQSIFLSLQVWDRNILQNNWLRNAISSCHHSVSSFVSNCLACLKINHPGDILMILFKYKKKRWKMLHTLIWRNKWIQVLPNECSITFRNLFLNGNYKALSRCAVTSESQNKFTEYLFVPVK